MAIQPTNSTMVNGKPVDPAPFFEAGRLAFKG